MFPNTIAWTFTAVPRFAGMSFNLLYVMARGLFQELKTASAAMRSCICASCGKSFPVMLFTFFLKPAAISFKSATFKSTSSLMLRASFFDWSMCSNSSFSMPMTTFPNIWMKRRYASQAKRSLPDFAIRPFIVLSFKPRFKTVSIMPGMENFAPERTETSSGLVTLPSFLPIEDSSLARFLSIS